jgi:hypothetical protein
VLVALPTKIASTAIANALAIKTTQAVSRELAMSGGKGVSISHQSADLAM